MEKNWYNLSVKETETNLETNLEEGLTTEQVTKAREKYGYNELKAQKKKSLFVKFLEQFKDFMIIILIIARGMFFCRNDFKHIFPVKGFF